MHTGCAKKLFIYEAFPINLKISVFWKIVFMAANYLSFFKSIYEVISIKTPTKF